MNLSCCDASRIYLNMFAFTIIYRIEWGKKNKSFPSRKITLKMDKVLIDVRTQIIWYGFATKRNVNLQVFLIF